MSGPPSGQGMIRQQLRTRDAREAFEPDMVICCGHALDAHDDDGCTVGWQAATDPGMADGCPCRVKGWAR